MKELFEYILIALACPLVLPLVEPHAFRNREKGIDYAIDVIRKGKEDD